MSYSGAMFPVLELLIRLAVLNPAIGEYICHQQTGFNVVVVTTGGSIVIPLEIIALQQRDPERVDETTLKLLAFSF